MKEIQSRRREEKSGASIDIIPLMDVIFLLLCFFILLTLNMVYQRGMEVNLAESKTGTERTEPVEKVTVTVRENGQYHVGDATVSDGTLSSRLKTMKEKNQELTVYVKAARQARHHRIVTAMDAIRNASIDRVIFSVRPDT